MGQLLRKSGLRRRQRHPPIPQTEGDVCWVRPRAVMGTESPTRATVRSVEEVEEAALGTSIYSNLDSKFNAHSAYVLGEIAVHLDSFEPF